jgi:hypothetical protein
LFKNSLWQTWVAKQTNINLSGKAVDLKDDSIEKIMSEGEQRGVALAGFFAELSITPSTSAIVFDYLLI